MEAAVLTARRGADRGEFGIAALVLDAEYRCLAARCDEVRSSRDPTAHASVLALRDAARQCSTWRLVGAQLFVTREPCALCAGAAVSARLARVVVAAADEDAGCLGSRYNFGTDPRLNHEFAIRYGLSSSEADSVYLDSLQVPRGASARD